MNNDNVYVCTSKAQQSMLAKIADISEDEVLCRLLDIAQEPLSKVRSKEYSRHWAEKKVQWLDTPLYLKVKVKFTRHHQNNLKKGDLECTYALASNKILRIKESDIQAIMTEQILLGYRGESQ